MFTVSKDVVRITKDEEDTFCKAIDKLARLSNDRRRRTKVWAEIRKLLELTGNWKKASRGKPRRSF